MHTTEDKFKADHREIDRKAWTGLIWHQILEFHKMRGIWLGEE